MKTQSSDCQIKSIYQLCVRRLSGSRFNFAFIYEMTGGGFSFQEYELTYDQARVYFAKHDWPLVLPEIEGKTVQVIRNGRFVSLRQRPDQGKELPP